MKTARIILLSVVVISLIVDTWLFAGSATAQQLDGPFLIESFPVAGGASGLAFDGANIWTLDVDNSTVTKLRASDGVILGTFPVGLGPSGIVFDGANIWVCNAYSDNLTKLRASDGTLLDTFDVRRNPLFLAWDG